MTEQILSEASSTAPATVHVWLTLDEAARTLDISPGLMSCQVELGELESRVNATGVHEVLVALPPRSVSRESTERVEVSIVPGPEEHHEPLAQPGQAMPAMATALAPLLQSMRRAQAKEVRGARRAARIAWTAAAVIALGVGAGVPLGVRELTTAQQQVRHLSETVDQAHAVAGQIDSERQALRAQLAEAREAASRAQGELAVERKVEDALFTATLASHNLPKSGANTPVLANSAD